MLYSVMFSLNANVGRIERSLPTIGNQPTHSHAQSPSIGSFQDFSRQLELPMDPRLKVLTHTSKRFQEEKDDGLKVGGQSSPKCKKLLKNKTDPKGMEEQAFTPRTVENLEKNFGNAKTSIQDPGAEAATGRGNNHRSRGKSIDRGARKGSRSPKHRRGVVAKVEKPSSKRRLGGQKIMSVVDIEVTPRDSKKTDEFEEGSDEEGSKSDNPRADGFEDGEQGNEGEGNERSPAATKLAGKKVRVGRGGKKPVAERVSVSKVTRATKGATPK